MIIVENEDDSKAIDFVLKLGIVTLLCNYLMKSDNNGMLIECSDFIVSLFSGTPTQVMIFSFNEK